MLPRNRWFIAAALAYALLGGILGLAWLAFPGSLPPHALRAHAHLMLAGFVGMMVFGVGLHVLPRFTGRSLFSERLADAQFVLVNGKWVGGVPAPFDGTIERINPAVQSDPGLVNVAPYTNAWLVVLRPDDLQAAYQRLKRGPEAIEALKAWIDKYGLQCMRCAQ